MKKWKGVTVGGFLVLLVVSISTLHARKAPRLNCAIVHIVDVWKGPYGGDSGSGALVVPQFHGVVVERFEFVIGLREMAPVWPRALMCSLPPEKND